MILKFIFSVKGQISILLQYIYEYLNINQPDALNFW